MAEGGQRRELSHSVVMSSEVYHEYSCQPCDIDGKHTEATSYCTNCKEYLCQTCCSYHRKFKQMRDHILQDLKQMSDKPPMSKSISTEKCSDHAGKAVTMAESIAWLTSISDTDRHESSISGSALLSQNKILLGDEYNLKVKLHVVTNDGRQVSEKRLSGWPWQMTKVNETEVAVTLPWERKIALLRTEPQITVAREISVNGRCYGIAYSDNRFLVTFVNESLVTYDSRVDIINTSGRVLQTIETDHSGQRMFNNPIYVTVSPDNSSMYVSDSGRTTQSLVKVSMEGRRLATYKAESDNSIGEAVVDSHGMVYIAWWSPYTENRPGGVDQLTANLEKVRTLIREVTKPETISYNETTQCLSVGRGTDVTVYKLS